jgi:hypothetical protein
MKKGVLFMVVIVYWMISMAVFPVHGAIPKIERAALIAFYNTTGGDDWTNADGWKTPPLDSDGFAMPGSEGDWFGVTVIGDHVTRLALMFNNLTGHMPPELGDLSELERLELPSNYTLGGIIPPELGKLSKLISLNATVNRLTGPMPPELGNLTNLVSISLYANYLEGPIPPELGNLTKLESIMMGWNLLTGGIPSSFGNLTRLEWLDFYANKLDGSIPPEVGNLTNLKYLGLYWNAMRGEIPTTLVNLTGTEIKISYNALHTDDAPLRAFLDANATGWENSQTIAPSNVSVTPVSDTSAQVSWNPISYYWDSGAYLVYYRTSTGGSWTLAGMTADKSTSSYLVTGLEAGQNYCFKVQTRTLRHSQNENTVNSEFSPEVCTAVGAIGPFGSFDTPLDGSTVMSSIPVTGWALDDFGVSHVKIYRDAVAAEQSNGALVYIGDADFVEGARPDVAQAYPDYPNNNSAGWGYMLLTNTLPNNGNGTFKLHAIASDVEGAVTPLGSKTITCDNINAVKPFGAIDTPSQGGTASGDKFVNFGWVLTPAPNTIPFDGSTINVWVDGAPLGHPVYNQYRADIAGLFPGYNNSQGAIGYFYIDTTMYENGAHTIQWTATDDAGNSDGIGSRYFTIQNPARRSRAKSAELINISRLPIPDFGPTRFKTGYNRDALPKEISANEHRVIEIEIPEVQRVEIELGKGPWQGWMMTHNGLTRLPIGSSIDKVNGVFYWQPCAGFLGDFHFLFIRTTANNELKAKRILIKIIPKDQRLQ